MAKTNDPKTQHQDPKTSVSPSSTKPSIEPNNKSNSKSYSGQRIHYPNPPESINPDAASLRDQWRFAIKQYSKWYSHAWSTAFVAGGAFFALGWIIKGANPLPSRGSNHQNSEGSSSNSDQNTR